MLAAAKQLQSELEVLFAPHSIFVAATLRSDKSDPTTYEVLDPEFTHVRMKNVRDQLVLLAVLGLDIDLSQDHYKLKDVLLEGGGINEALLRENAPSEAAFEKTLQKVQDRMAVLAYHKERIAARAAWAQETKVSITYAEYYGLRQLVQKAQLDREDAIRLFEAVGKAVAGAAASLKDG